MVIRDTHPSGTSSKNSSALGKARLYAASKVACLATVALLGLTACGTTSNGVSATPGVDEAGKAPALDPVLVELVGRKLKRSISVPDFENLTDYGRDTTTLGGETLAEHSSEVVRAHLAATKQFLPFDPASSPEPPRTDYMVKGRLQLLGVMELPQTRGAARRGPAKAIAEVQLQVLATATGRPVFQRKGRAERPLQLRVRTQKLDDETTRELVAEAVGSVMDEVVEELLDSPWSTSVLMMYGANCVISGGSALGLKIGDQLVVVERPSPGGNSQTGQGAQAFPVEVARIQIESSFGGDSAGEASICKVISGDLTRIEPTRLVVQQQVYAAPPR